MLEAPMLSKQQFSEELTAQLSPSTILRCDEPLAKKTTLRVGGPADFYVEPASEVDLQRVLHFCMEKQLPFFVLGRGSNLLIKDCGVRGFVISLHHASFSEIKITGESLSCGAGAKLKAVAVEARKNNLTGLEFLEGIPGNVGGALRMNAGAMGSATFNAVEKIRLMDWSGKVQEISRKDISVEYRSCPLLKNKIALGAVFRGQTASSEIVAERMMKFSSKRWESQPKEPSAGCIFKNSDTIPAGKLIQELDLKNTSVGGARVSDVHGNFIVNDGTATAQNVLDLIELIKQRARTARGIELRTEVEIIGE
ncbi:MAG: UDP-N-acetylmuramate dehydrogenase [Verrucomicrobiota bacterium]